MKLPKVPALGVTVGRAVGTSENVSVIVASSPELSRLSLLVITSVGAEVSRVLVLNEMLAVCPASPKFPAASA